jgi:pimeloyl-ACP methyl ester carboxylesterase
VYGYDPPGHGLSGGTWWGRADLPGLVEHLRAWLTVKGFGSVPIVGHSLGGEVLFDLAARYPECLSALIAVAPTGIPENPSVRVQLTRLMKDLGYGKGYQYDPDTPEGFSGANFFPDGMDRRTFYAPKGEGHEQKVKARLERWSEMRARLQAEQGEET